MEELYDDYTFAHHRQATVPATDCGHDRLPRLEPLGLGLCPEPERPTFGTNLRGAGNGGISVALPDPVTQIWWQPGVTHYTIDVDQYEDNGVAPTLGPTTLRGFNPANPAGPLDHHLGGLLVAQKNQPVQITFRNNIPGEKHIIPNDLTIPGANEGNNRVSIHLHGGLVPWISDGGPFAWWDPLGHHGISFLNNQVLNPTAPPGEAEFYYPMNQSARLLWYHDHALGITRINAYAGIASGVLLRDAFEADLVTNRGLPAFLERGGFELPIIVQDKTFVGPLTAIQDPTWGDVVAPVAKRNGSLWYPHIYDPARWALKKNAPLAPPPDPSVVAEAFGDTMLVNGTCFPKVTVEPRRYRLRFLNACNARFLNLQLYIADASANGITLDPMTGFPLNRPAECNPLMPQISGQRRKLLQIGTEGGFLARPA
jgi:spore coat protein A